MSTMITREPTRNDIAHCQARRGSRRRACCALSRPWRGFAQPQVHEERFAARNTFRREFGLLLRCVARRSEIAGAEILSYQEAQPAVTLSFRARMQELRVISRGKTGGPP